MQPRSWAAELQDLLTNEQEEDLLTNEQEEKDSLVLFIYKYIHADG